MQNWKKGYVFGHFDKFWNGHDAQIKKNASKNAYLGSIFIPEKYVFRVCFENPFTRMISSLKYKWPPGGVKGDPGQSAPLDSEKIAQNREKWEKIRKKREKNR